jgi:hypothetical protein
MYALPGRNESAIAGRLIADEADMWGGPGDAQWTGESTFDQPVCVPAEESCGYTAMRELRADVGPGVLTYANYGKGVSFWDSPPEAKRFVNEFQDVVSVDNYWFTDTGVCVDYEGGAMLLHSERALSPDECHRASNYGATTKHVRALVDPPGSKPVWNFVEVGHPTDEGRETSISGPEIRAAVWSSLIRGARGIVYFNHSFGGPCQSFNVLREACGDPVRESVRALNAQVRNLAPVLNSRTVDGFARTDADVDLMTKLYDGNFYVFAGARRATSSYAAIELACGEATTVDVIDENRTLAITDSTLRDQFTDGNAVHIYRIPEGSDCGLPR